MRAGSIGLTCAYVRVCWMCIDSGGVNNASGGNFLHKGWETSEMWRWPCSATSWPEAMVASPPSPPFSPPPPSLPPGSYTGGYRGYVPVAGYVPDPRASP